MRRCRRCFYGLHNSQHGFSLLELIVVFVIMGIITAVAAPNWLRFLDTQQVVVAQDKVLLGIRQAQAKAQQTNQSWRFGIRQMDDGVEWAVYSEGTDLSSIHWQTLNRYVQIDDETSFRRASSGIYSVKFDYKGNARILGRVTLSGKNSSEVKRCVIVSTLLGQVRKAKARATPEPTYRRRDRYCY